MVKPMLDLGWASEVLVNVLQPPHAPVPLTRGMALWALWGEPYKPPHHWSASMRRIRRARIADYARRQFTCSVEEAGGDTIV